MNDAGCGPVSLKRDTLITPAGIGDTVQCSETLGGLDLQGFTIDMGWSNMPRGPTSHLVEALPGVVRSMMSIGTTYIFINSTNLLRGSGRAVGHCVVMVRFTPPGG